MSTKALIGKIELLQKNTEPKLLIIDDTVEIKRGNRLKEVSNPYGASKKPDWKNNSNMRNRIEGEVEELFWDMEDTYGVKFDDSDELLAKIQSLGISNY